MKIQSTLRPLAQVALLSIATAVLCVFTAGEDGSTRPVAGIRDKTPQIHALTGARIVIAPGQVVEKGTVVIRDGNIVAAGPKVGVPDDARVWDLTGKTIYPGLIDAFGEIDVATQSIQHGAAHWNPLITPQLAVAENYQADAAKNEALRKQGVTARLVAPAKGIIKGTSALVATGDDTNVDAILNAAVAQHVRLTASRRGREQYPNSPMGAVALARQTIYDANWHRDVWRAWEADTTLPRPERNDALSALQPYVDAGGLMIADSLNELYFLRADRFAREFGLNVAIRGSGDEYRRLEAIAATGRTVIVPVRFPKPPNVGSAEAELNVSLADMLHWDLAPENPARLEKAGVRFALTSDGLKDTATFLKAVRKAVERGLSPDGALRALTTVPAELCGVADRLGSIERGRLANLFVTDGDLFDESTKIVETWVLGRRYEFVDVPVVDIVGSWQIETKDSNGKPLKLNLELTGTAEKLSGTIRLPAAKSKKPEQAAKETKLLRASLGDTRFRTVFEGKEFGQQGIARLSAVVSQDAEELHWLGTIIWPDGTRWSLTAAATAAPEDATAANTDDSAAGKPGDPPNSKRKSPSKEPSKETKQQQADPPDSPVVKTAAASFPVNFPLGAFGVESPAERPEFVLVKNATIWTSGPQGTIPNASLLVHRGKIAAVGKEVAAPADALVIDAAGKHLTAGIIDCHSHMATDGGINESTQAITAEVRIGDFVDCDDIAIYRQLAGGVTCANILHGSANPIGGQNQVVKLRWGALPEAMKFAEAPQGIKFALGENVKQSNWGDEYTTRYPQSRMGVEQIMRDAFQAAREYRQRWQAWRTSHQGLPPRRDLELDAISEILTGDRWVHCHSYRQDEILALIRTLDDFQVTIGTFQHILEGYKVADAMAKHGAMGSAFSDWWAYKFEVYDAIPYNGALMHNAGVVVSFNSDDRELARHLNHEAAKAMKYGGVPADEALKFVTLNPARQLRIDRYVGSIEVGKHADFVIWSGSPLSTFSRCEQTWIDGRRYFDIQEDRQRRARASEIRTALVQKILASGETMLKPGEGEVDSSSLWPREDLFCHAHGHDHGHDHGQGHRHQSHENGEHHE